MPGEVGIEFEERMRFNCPFATNGRRPAVGAAAGRPQVRGVNLDSCRESTRPQARLTARAGFQKQFETIRAGVKEGCPKERKLDSLLSSRISLYIQLLKYGGVILPTIKRENALKKPRCARRQGKAAAQGREPALRLRG